MQPLLGDLALGDQTTTMTHRRPQLGNRIVHEPATVNLAGQVGQRGAVPIVGLEPARTQLSAGCCRLRRSKDPHRCRETSFQRRGPRAMKTASGLDRDHRTITTVVVSDQP